MTTSDTRRADPSTVAGFRPGLPARLAVLPAGRWSKYAVLCGLLALLALAVPLAGQVGDVEENGPTSSLPRGAESTRVEQQLPDFDTSGVLNAVVVYTRNGGLTDADRAAISNDRASLAGLANGGAITAAPSEDGGAATLTLPIDSDADDAFDRLEQVRDQSTAGTPDGLQVHVTGPMATVYDSVSAFDGVSGKILGASVLVVAVMLLITYRSPVLWIVPLIAIGNGAAVSEAAIYLLAKHANLPVDGQSGGILPVLVFGVGTDYALLLIARYREELHHDRDRHRAMARAMRRAGPAIAASAGTVVLGLGCLVLADVNSTRSLGVVGAVGVACAAAAMLVVLPLLMVLLGRWVFWPFIPRVGAEGATPAPHRGRLARMTRLLARHPRAIWTATAAALAALALGSLTMTVGTTDAQQFRTTPDSVTGQRILAQHYPAGAAAPLDIVTDAKVTDRVARIVESAPGVDTVAPPVSSSDGEHSLLRAVLTTPPDSEAAKDTVVDLRDRLDALPDGSALIGGPTAKAFDVRTASAGDARLVIPAVLLVVLIVLMLLMRAVTGPLLMLGSVLLSYAAAFGAGALVMSLMGFDAVDVSLPLLAFVFLVALGVDYTIFLMSRVREEVQREGHERGVLNGLASTAGVITSAGLVLAATFSVLAVMPIVFMIGLGVMVAVGILLDTFVVRTLLLPALALDVGPRLWWPSRLSREAVS